MPPKFKKYSLELLTSKRKGCICCSYNFLHPHVSGSCHCWEIRGLQSVVFCHLLSQFSFSEKLLAWYGMGISFYQANPTFVCLVPSHQLYPPVRVFHIVSLWNTRESEADGWWSSDIQIWWWPLWSHFFSRPDTCSMWMVQPHLINPTLEPPFKSWSNHTLYLVASDKNNPDGNGYEITLNIFPSDYLKDIL